MQFRNDTSEDIPAYAVLRATGYEEFGDRNVLTVEKPDSYGSQHLHFVNGMLKVPPDGYGVCYNPSEPWWALYDDADTPAFGETWGPVDGSWELKKHVGGFRVVGGAIGGIESTSRVLVVRAPMLIFRGKITADITIGTTGTVTVWHMVDGVDEETEYEIEDVYSPFGTVETGSGNENFVGCHWVNDQWEIWQSGC